MFQQQNQATHLKSLLPQLLLLYIYIFMYLFAIYRYAQTWGVGLQLLASILPACLKGEE